MQEQVVGKHDQILREYHTTTNPSMPNTNPAELLQNTSDLAARPGRNVGAGTGEPHIRLTISPKNIDSAWF